MKHTNPFKYTYVISISMLGVSAWRESRPFHSSVGGNLLLLAGVIMLSVL